MYIQFDENAMNNQAVTRIGDAIKMVTFRPV